MSRIRSIKRKIDLEAQAKGFKFQEKVERSLNAMRIPKGKRNGNHWVRAQNKVLARRKEAHA